MTTSLFKLIKLVKLKFVLGPELHYMPDGITFELYNISNENFTVVDGGLENRPRKISYKSIDG